MTDEADLTIRILREIQATQAEHTKELAGIKTDIAGIKTDIAAIKETQTLHSLHLQNHSDMFATIQRILRGMADRLRGDPPADVAEQLRAIDARLSALEGQQQ